MTETEAFNKANNYRKKTPECCLTCIHARRWAFESSYSENPSDLSAYCLHQDAPHQPIMFGGRTERKVVNAFSVCDKYQVDKEMIS